MRERQTCNGLDHLGVDAAGQQEEQEGERAEHDLHGREVKSSVSVRVPFIWTRWSADVSSQNEDENEGLATCYTCVCDRREGG